MDGFVGRNDDLEYLENLYRAAPQSCAIYGRKRLGKTALMQKFCEYKRHIYISGSVGLKSECLRSIEEAVGRFTGEKESIEDIEDLFGRLKKICARRTVVIFDNYSWLLELFPEMYGAVSRFLSRDMKNTRIFFIACDTDSTVFGRIANLREIRPMSYLECTGFHPGYTVLQHLQAYAMVGGTPAYHRLLEGKPEDAVRNQFLGGMSVFSLEAEFNVNSQASDREACIRILYAMASGAETLKDIVAASGLNSGQCQKAIEDMENKGLVFREHSDFDSRNWVCGFGSNILRFYYTVVAKCRMGDDFFSEDKAFVGVAKEMDPYLSGIFKSISREYIRIHYDCNFVGKIRSGSSAPEVEYVAVARDADGKKITVCSSSRYCGEPMDVRDLKRLQNGSKKLKISSPPLYLMFSGCGFGGDLREAAESRDDIVLLTLDDMYAPLESGGRI